MIQVYRELGEPQIKEIESYFQQDEKRIKKFKRQVDDVKEFYDNDMPPFLIGRNNKKVTGIVILETVEEAAAYGSIVTEEPSFINELRDEFLKYHVFEVSLSSETELMQDNNFQFEDADYKMVLSVSDAKRLLEQQKNLKDQVILQPVKPSDQEYYTYLLRLLFCMSDEDATERFHEVVHEKEIQGYLVRHNGQSIGIASSYSGDTFTTLFDLAIEPLHQGMGYGKKMLYAIIDRTINRECKYLLQVTHSNTNAVHLYQKSGFCIDEQQMVYHLTMK